MSQQSHSGSGDNVAGNKYELHISGIQPLPRLLTKLPRLQDRLIGRERELEQEPEHSGKPVNRRLENRLVLLMPPLSCPSS